MTDKFEEKEISDKDKKNQSLTNMQKLFFGLICWGVHTRSQVDSFKTNGYDQKYEDAKKAIRTGFLVYGISIAVFILIIIFTVK